MRLGWRLEEHACVGSVGSVWEGHAKIIVVLENFF